MNRFLRTKHGKVMTIAAAAVTGTLAFAGVASAAGSGSTTPTGGVKVGQALKEIRQELRAGTTSGQVTVTTKKGTQVVSFERGVVSDATGASFDVTAPGSSAQNWLVGPKTKVRARRARRDRATTATPTTATPTAASVTDGESVIVLGLDADGVATARLVVVLPAASAGTAAPDATGTSLDS